VDTIRFSLRRVNNRTDVSVWTILAQTRYPTQQQKAGSHTQKDHSHTPHPALDLHTELVSQDRFQFGASKKEEHNIAVKGVAFPQQVDGQMVEQGCELHLLISPCCFPAPINPWDTRSPL